MSEERELMLAEALKKIKGLKTELVDKIKAYREEIERYKESNKELEDNLSVEVYNAETDKEINNIKTCEEYKEAYTDILNHVKAQRERINEILNFSININNIDNFFDLVTKLNAYEAQEVYNDCSKLSKQTTVKLTIKPSDIVNFNNVRGSIVFIADTILTKGAYFEIDYSKKLEEASKIKGILRKPEAKNFVDTLIKFLSDNLKEIDQISKRSGEKIQAIRDREIKKRKDEINSNINELERKIEECKGSLETIEKIFELYEAYKETEDKSTLYKLTNELTNLVVISQREAKLMTYEPTEKEKEVEEAPKVEEKSLEEIKPVELDNDYFRNKDTNYIVCFLGEEGDTINEDINNHFDKSKVKPVLSELFTLFTVLTTTNDYIKDKGGNPHEGSSKKALSLLRSPLDFAYKRFGVRNDKFRIHAISRNSSLLKELGFGSGNIIFFGAVGVNDDKEKSDAYNRVGKRAIDSLSKKNEAPKLRPNFDFIEHITRGYVPKKLFSEGDLEKASRGDFNRRLKGNIEMSIEHGRFVLYSVLDDTTKSNVKKWLEEYFIKQTTTLFEIKSRYEKVSGNTLD